jgi:hypothetical protein
MRKASPAVLDEFSFGRSRIAGLVRKLNDRLYLSAELTIRHPDYGNIRNRGMRRQQILNLLRIDIHAAGYNDIRPAVGEIEISIIV